jgi:hypothetical protein
MMICGVLLQEYAKIEREIVQSIESKWTIDVCLAMFIYGDMTYEGYQALINLMSREYCPVDGDFKDMLCRYGSRYNPRCNPH